MRSFSWSPCKCQLEVVEPGGTGCGTDQNCGLHASAGGTLAGPGRAAGPSENSGSRERAGAGPSAERPWPRPAHPPSLARNPPKRQLQTARLDRATTPSNSQLSPQPPVSRSVAMFASGSPASQPFGRQSSYSSQPGPGASTYQPQATSSFGGPAQFGMGSSSGWQGGSGSQSFGQGGQHNQFGGQQPGSPMAQQQSQYNSTAHFGNPHQPTSPGAGAQNQNQNFGEGTKRAYLPGYLSSRTQVQVSTNIPAQWRFQPDRLLTIGL